MAYRLTPVNLTLATDVTHQCSLHRTRDQHLIGILAFSKPHDSELTWADIEYCRRRIDEFSVMPFPECISALIIDIQDIPLLIDDDIALTPWRLLEEECSIRLVVAAEHLAYYVGIFEPTWLCTDTDTAIKEIREFMDMFVH
ncbi:MAG: hypothetical protein E6Q25_08655 [Acinetobacter sp.]|jgi:hypothetical protein|nr:MAG: hypothetical protein E6Q25_08655 [Acinetobacter sp.]